MHGILIIAKLHKGLIISTRASAVAPDASSPLATSGLKCGRATNKPKTPSNSLLNLRTLWRYLIAPFQSRHAGYSPTQRLIQIQNCGQYSVEWLPFLQSCQKTSAVAYTPLPILGRKLPQSKSQRKPGAKLARESWLPNRVIMHVPAGRNPRKPHVTTAKTERWRVHMCWKSELGECDLQSERVCRSNATRKQEIQGTGNFPCHSTGAGRLSSRSTIESGTCSGLQCWLLIF